MKKSAFITLALASQFVTASSAMAQDAAKGREIFVKVGCYSCHGYNGQGGVTGPKLAPEPLAAKDIATFIRNAGPTRMPQYVEKVLSDEDIGHIHAWLASQPKQKNYKDIPLLNQ